MSTPDQTLGFHEDGLEAVQAGDRTATIRRDPRKITTGDRLLATRLDGTPGATLEVTHSATAPIADAIDVLEIFGGDHPATCTADLLTDLAGRYPRAPERTDPVTILVFEVTGDA